MNQESNTTAAQHGWAKLLYISHSNSIKDIFISTGAPEAAIHNWIQQEHWDDHRSSLLTSRQTQLGLLYDILARHIQKFTTRADDEKAETNAKDADLLLKYTAAIKNLEKDTSIREIVEVAKLFDSWLLSNHETELLKTVSRQFDEFINFRLKKGYK